MFKCRLKLLVAACIYVYSFSSANVLALETSELSLAPVNIKASYPQTVSAEIGILFSQGGLGPASSSGDYTGLYISAEPGLRGAKAHVGYMHIECRSFLGFWGHRAFLEYYRTYNMPDSLPNARNYLGLGVSGSAYLFVPTLEALYDPSENDSILSIGIGIGL